MFVCPRTGKRPANDGQLPGPAATERNVFAFQILQLSAQTRDCVREVGRQPWSWLHTAGVFQADLC